MRHPLTLLCASLSLLMTGCSDMGTLTPQNAIPVTGNWQLTATSTNAAKLPSLSGEFTGNSTHITAILHSNAASACVAPAAAVELSGATDTKGSTTLTGALSGGTLTITGTLAQNGKSFTTASYNVTGGACAFPAAATATAQAYTPIAGNFAGNFTDMQGDTIAIAATLSQTPASDTSGNFQLSGTATFPQNPCFNSPVTASNTQVTGGSFTITYADPVTTNSVTASGTFSTDGTLLTVSPWTLTGPCGPINGTGSLLKQ